MLRARLLVALVVSSFGFGASAGDLQSELRRCAGISDSLQRLVCYDALAGNVAPTPSPSRAAAVEQAQVSTRCQATTKKGTQCLRNAQPGSRYCWQHNRR